MGKFSQIIVFIAGVISVLVPIPQSPAADAHTNATWAWPGGAFTVNTVGAVHLCSVGFPARDRSGTRYFITAGHCFRSEDGKTHYLSSTARDKGLDIFKLKDQFWPSGFEKTYFTVHSDNSFFDISLVQMYPLERLNSGWPHLPNTVHHGLAGDTACLAAFPHEIAMCGNIVATDETVSYPHFGFIRHGLSRTSYCPHKGDNGGAVYNDSGALGIEVDIPQDRLKDSCHGYFIPIATVLNTLNIYVPGLTLA